MISDVSQIGEKLSADLCIVGGGAAGLSLAHALAAKGFEIVLLEVGGRQETAASRDFYKGEVDNEAHPAPEHYRVAALGGSSRAWGGGCVTLDPIDFAERDWLGQSGWPISYDDLARYYDAALDAAEAGPVNRAASPLCAPLEGPFTTIFERFSRPTDFGRRWGPALARSPRVKVVLNAAATDIRTAGDGRFVTAIEATAPDGRKIEVTARAHVIASGGLEAPRLLLNSTQADPRGIGNRHDWVGRGYMCHLAGIVGHVTFGDPAEAGRCGLERDGEIYVRRRLALSASAQRRLKVLNLAFRFQRQDGGDPSHGDPVLSLIHLHKRLRDDRYSRQYRELGHRDERLRGHLANVVKGPHQLAAFVAAALKGRYIDTRRLPVLPYRRRDQRFALEFHAEQAPNRDSRVILSEARDRFGNRRLRIEWRTLPIDTETVRQAYHMLKESLASTGAGTLDYDENRLEEHILKGGAYGGHHIGATRMSRRPEDGVVDLDCRVHGVDNLYIASASVMPTSGQANPTLSILAIAYRLADHLADRLSQQDAPLTASDPVWLGAGPEPAHSGDRPTARSP